MNVFFAPYYENNPYQAKIIEELKKYEVEVNIANTGSSAFFKTKNLKNASLIHFHWFEPFVKASSVFRSLSKIIFFLSKLALLKKNKKYVWTVHNLVNHEKKNVYLDKLFLRFFTKMIDVFFVHNEHSKKQLILNLRIPERKIVLVPHGNYVSDYKEFDGDKNTFKKEVMGIDTEKFIFSFIGNVRPYKGVLELIDAFVEMNSPDAILLICGHVTFQDDITLIEQKIAQHPSIVFKPGYVHDDELEGYIKCSDVMVYPYKDILTSGSLILGMSMAKPCIVSNVGSMQELIDPAYVFDSYGDLSKIMTKMLAMQSENLMKLGNKNLTTVKGDTWNNMAKIVSDTYDKLRVNNG